MDRLPFIIDNEPPPESRRGLIPSDQARQSAGAGSPCRRTSAGRAAGPVSTRLPYIPGQQEQLLPHLRRREGWVLLPQAGAQAAHRRAGEGGAAADLHPGALPVRHRAQPNPSGQQGHRAALGKGRRGLPFRRTHADNSVAGCGIVDPVRGSQVVVAHGGHDERAAGEGVLHRCPQLRVILRLTHADVENAAAVDVHRQSDGLRQRAAVPPGGHPRGITVIAHDGHGHGLRAQARKAQLRRTQQQPRRGGAVAYPVLRVPAGEDEVLPRLHMGRVQMVCGYPAVQKGDADGLRLRPCGPGPGQDQQGAQQRRRDLFCSHRVSFVRSPGGASAPPGPLSCSGIPARRG